MTNLQRSLFEPPPDDRQDFLRELDELDVMMDRSFNAAWHRWVDERRQAMGLGPYKNPGMPRRRKRK